MSAHRLFFALWRLYRHTRNPITAAWLAATTAYRRNPF